MKDRIKDYLSFSKSERIGIIVLISIILVLIILPHVVQLNRKSVPLSNADDLYKIEVEAFMQGIKETQYKESDSWNNSENNEWNNSTDFGDRKKSRFTPFAFDPNTANKEEWIKMGFSEKQAAVILKYRERGGHFNRKEDFSKLYIVDEETYRIFEPYITIHDSFQKESFNANQVYTGKQTFSSNQSFNRNQTFNGKQKRNLFAGNYEAGNGDIKVELNSADSMELLKINGVGPVFASRILKYRKRLGGFTSTGQLTEVYGMDSLRFSGIADQITVDTALIKEIDVNASSLTELRKHPYLDYYSAKSIIDRRVQLGGFRNLMEIQSALAGKPGLFRKLRPYIKIY